MDSEEKRQHERKLLRADAKVADLMGRSWMPIRLLDISEAGIAFTTDEEVAIDDIRMIEFSLPENPTRIRCEVKVVNLLVNRAEENSAPGKYRLGAIFDRIDSEDISLIEQFIQE
jgi:hypothetical protein